MHGHCIINLRHKCWPIKAVITVQHQTGQSVAAAHMMAPRAPSVAQVLLYCSSVMPIYSIRLCQGKSICTGDLLHQQATAELKQYLDQVNSQHMT